MTLQATQAAEPTTAPVPTEQVEEHLRPGPKHDLGKEYLDRVARINTTTGEPAATDTEEAQAETRAAAGPEPTADAALDPKASEQLAALMRRDREVRKRERELSEQAGELERLRALEKSLKGDPLESLKAIGVDFDTLAERYLSQGKPSAEKQIAELNAKIDELRAERERERKEAEERETTAKVEKAKQAFRDEIATTIAAAGDEFEIIRAEKQEGLVYNVIEQHYDETGRVLDIREAAALVEKHLEEQRRQLLSTKKFSSLLRAHSEPAGDESREHVTAPRASGPKPPEHNADTQPLHDRLGRKPTREELTAEAARLLRFVNGD